MKLDEFEAWFNGYTEDLAGPPTEKQWARIKEQVGKIDGVPVVTQTVFVEHYRPHYERWLYGHSVLMGNSPGMGVSNNFVANAAGPAQDATQLLDGVSAMYAVGKMEALAN